MIVKNEQPTSIRSDARKFRWRRIIPLIVVACISLAVVAMGWHRQLSFGNLLRHHEELRSFIAAHEAGALAAYVAFYIAAVALSLPVGAYISMAGGMLFGAVTGGIAAVIGASIGAVLIFLIAKSALGEQLVRRAGPAAEKIAQGFREDAFSYLLFLRLVPAFPFWLVNLVPALAGVRLAPFAAATAIGIMPATFAFAFVGSGLESAIAAQKRTYESCLAAGRGGCKLAFHASDALTPQLIGALVALGVLALVPVAVKRLRGRG